MFVRHSYGIKGMFADDLLDLDESGDIAQIIDFLEQLIRGHFCSEIGLYRNLIQYIRIDHVP